MQPEGSDTASRGLRQSVSRIGKDDQVQYVSGSMLLLSAGEEKGMENKHSQSIGTDHKGGGQDEKGA